jgi:rhodanese-related sulfurtransferase
MSVVEFFQAHPIIVGLWLVVGVMLLLSLAPAAGKNIAPQQLTDLVNREDAVVLDIRSAADFGKGHIVGAINLPMSKLAQPGAELDRHKDRPLVIVCASGVTAVNACKLLQKAGFSKLFRLNNGMQAWNADNLPTSKK